MEKIRFEVIDNKTMLFSKEEDINELLSKMPTDKLIISLSWNIRNHGEGILIQNSVPYIMKEIEERRRITKELKL